MNGHTKDTPVLQTLPQTLELLGDGRLIIDPDDSSIGTDNPVWGQYRKGGSNTKKDDHQESLRQKGAMEVRSVSTSGPRRPTEWGTYNICGGCHGIQMTFSKIDSKGDDGTDEGTKLEDGPEDTERLAFILLEWVTHHNTSLSRPEQSGGDTEDCAGKNQEPACTLRLVTG